MLEVLQCNGRQPMRKSNSDEEEKNGAPAVGSPFVSDHLLLSRSQLEGGGASSVELSTPLGFGRALGSASPNVGLNEMVQSTSAAASRGPSSRPGNPPPLTASVIDRLPHSALNKSPSDDSLRSPSSRSERAAALGLKVAETSSEGAAGAWSRQRAATTGNVADPHADRPRTHAGATNAPIVAAPARSAATAAADQKSLGLVDETGVSQAPRFPPSASPSEASTCSTATTVRAAPTSPAAVVQRAAGALPRESTDLGPASTTTASVALSAPPPGGFAPSAAVVNGATLPATSSASSSSSAASSATAGTPHNFKGNRPDDAIRIFGSKLTPFEHTEIFNFNRIYFVGSQANKRGGVPGGPNNSGYDDENGSYLLVPHDHIAYRYEILKVIGKGSFGQVIKAYDHKNQQFVALKLVRNEKRFHRQAEEEIRILDHLRAQDGDHSHNCIHMLDHFNFRNHKIITFELMSINLYELIKKNKFHGFNLTLVRKFAHSMLQCLELLHKNRLIHCDLKPENVLLKNPNRSSIKVLDAGKRTRNFFSSRGHPRYCQVTQLMDGTINFGGGRSKRGKMRGPPASRTWANALKNMGDDLFIDFLKRCLEWDPDLRMTPQQALKHAWLRRHGSGENLSSAGANSVDSDAATRESDSGFNRMRSGRPDIREVLRPES
ncbi:Dual-specificity kinase [Aphelenchoides fujianensis]|nr:Dual-specificity kinase [Aphelenchoides fujianensis]